jgi:hypothetical protein
LIKFGLKLNGFIFGGKTFRPLPILNPQFLSKNHHPEDTMKIAKNGKIDPKFSHHIRTMGDAFDLLKTGIQMGDINLSRNRMLKERWPVPYSSLPSHIKIHD